ncbi:cytochrome P450 [Kutzneria chonburiensis]|uniref:Cytochrome P450 n=1 Tax=Kutzneria chonburiensis TaxID=1483604 RepID=A0ABV6NB06_9PSEU|nr:cytochrome P450 [Kutzneria chonburiensis]
MTTHVHYDDRLGTWNVTGHPEMLSALNDPATFSSNIPRLFGEHPDDRISDGNLVQTDPPDHRKLRSLANTAFTPKVVAALQPRIVELTTELLDAVDGDLELVSQLAHPLPVIVIAELLGVPVSDRELFRQWADLLLLNDGEFTAKDEDGAQARRFQEMAAALQPMADYLLSHLNERRTRPREDLLTRLVQAELDGERLTDGQLVNFTTVLLLAGHITTTMLLTNTVLCLDENPEHAAKIRADRSLLPGAIEESLRLRSPFNVLARVTAVETALGGQVIPADRMVLLWANQANRDPRVFARPDEFDPLRDPNPHLSFGRGIHFCLGAPLARLEGRIALNLLLDRFPVLRTDPADPPVLTATTNSTGVSRLPLRTAY